MNYGTKELNKRIDNQKNESSGLMLSRNWLDENALFGRRCIDRYKEGFNLKDEELAPMSKANAVSSSRDIKSKNTYVNKFGDTIYKIDANNRVMSGDEKGNPIDVLTYQLNNPYKEVNINRHISFLNKDNVLQELLRFLIQFQQLNYLHTEFDLGEVYDEVVLSINSQTKPKLIPNPIQLKESTLDMAVTVFEDSIEGKGFSSVKDVVNGLGLYKEKTYYSNTDDVTKDGRGISIGGVKKHHKRVNDNLINDCIDTMIDADMFISPKTIKDQLYTTGRNQIQKVYKERRLELKQYNKNTFGVTTDAMFERKFSDN